MKRVLPGFLFAAIPAAIAPALPTTAAQPLPAPGVAESAAASSGLHFKLAFGADMQIRSLGDAADVRCGALADPPTGDDAAAHLTDPATHPSPQATPAAARSSASEIAKKLQNPVADLISVPIQWNINTGVGPDKQDQNIINIQPVIPFHITKEWNLITRTIIPIISTPVPDWEAGLGDIQLSLFGSPAAPSKFIWGVGPIFQFPSATNDALGQGKWCVGSTVVGLYMDGPWVVGALANNIWSFAGDDDRADVSQMLVQPFINYNFQGGWYLTSSPIITANWRVSSGDAWTVPLGAGVGKVFRLGDQIMNASMQVFYDVVSPNNGPEWTLRFELTFVFPER